MYHELDLDKINLQMVPPAEEPQRQYYFMAKAREMIRERSNNAGRALTACIKTFGCPKNDV